MADKERLSMAIKERTYTEDEVNEKHNELKEDIKLLKQALSDARYIMNQYNAYREDAWECVRKIINDPKLP